MSRLSAGTLCPKGGKGGKVMVGERVWMAHGSIEPLKNSKKTIILPLITLLVTSFCASYLELHGFGGCQGFRCSMPVIVDYDQSEVLRLPNGEPIAGSLGPDVCTEDEALVESLEMNGIEMIPLKKFWMFLSGLLYCASSILVVFCAVACVRFLNQLAKLKWNG